MEEQVPRPSEEQPKWEPLSAIDRRVAGVLVEKAKTTPDAYPLSLNAICTGSNQKSNRDPQMQLEPEDVEDSLERLRAKGAVGEVQGGGRVPKYRHYMYQWLGVEKLELAVMAELLLRGDQTEGELRGRAARMDAIADVAALRPILNSLKEKGLVISLTPEGRGHVVTHALYLPTELERLKQKYGTGSDTQAAPPSRPSPPPAAAPASTYTPNDGAIAAAASPSPVASRPIAPFAPDPTPPATPDLAGDLESLRGELSEARQMIGELRNDLQEMMSQLRDNQDEVRRLKDALGGI